MNATARDILIQDNYNLIYLVIRNLHLKATEDLVQEGTLGLIHAADNFDESKQIQFSTYAYTIINFYIRKYINYTNPFIKPARVRSKGTEELKFAEVVVTDKINDVINANGLFSQDDIESELFVESFMNTLNDDEKIIVNCLLKEMSQREIGNIIGVSQVQISRKVSTIRTKLLKYYDVDNHLLK